MTTRRNILVGLVTGALTLALAGSPAGATYHPRQVGGTGPAVHPEGVAWDPTRHAFLVSSVRNGTVSVVGRDGRARVLAADPRMVSTFGLHVDPRRNRFLVTYADLGLGTRSTPDTAARVAGVAAFDLATGREIFAVDLAVGPGRHLANDLAIAPDGTAYVTDPGSDAVYRVDRSGAARVLVRDPRFAAEGFGLNGIVWHPAGYLLAVHYTTGALYRIRGAAVTEVALDRPLTGGDGMALRPDGSLVVVTNGLASAGVDAVGTVRPTGRDWSAARTSRFGAWPVAGPSTVALAPDGAWVLSGRLETLIGGHTDDTFVLRRY